MYVCRHEDACPESVVLAPALLGSEETIAATIGVEQKRPALVGRLRQRRGRALFRSRACGHVGANAQPFLAIQPVQLLAVRDFFPRQQDAEFALAEAPPLAGQVAQPLADLRRIRHRCSPHRLRVHFDQPAGVALREAARRHQT